MNNTLLAASLVLLTFPSEALAQRRVPAFSPDVTLFIGLTTSAVRPTIGGAFGGGGSIVRFEVEYAGTPGAGTAGRPSEGGISVNILVQLPSPTYGVHFYGTGGVGFYGESFGAGGGSGEVAAKNIGVGAKMKLAGALGLRIDYRIFVLGSAPDAARGLVLQQHPQRIAVGLNFAF